MWCKTVRVFLCCSIFLFLAAEALPGQESSVVSEGGEKLDALLLKASNIEASAESHDDLWQAAALYCEACRLGSTEAQYRLGMLYAFGKGVPENRAYAASLFSIASQQGHAKAFDMLETVILKSEELPPCWTSGTLPEKRPLPVKATAEHTGPIDLYLESLPHSKS